MKIWNSEKRKKRKLAEEKRQKMAKARRRRLELDEARGIMNLNRSVYGDTGGTFIKNDQMLDYLAGQVYKQIKSLNLSEEGRSEFLDKYDIRIKKLVKKRFREEVPK